MVGGVCEGCRVGGNGGYSAHIITLWKSAAATRDGDQSKSQESDKTEKRKRNKRDIQDRKAVVVITDMPGEA